MVPPQESPTPKPDTMTLSPAFMIWFFKHSFNAINTVEELTHKSEDDMMKVRNLGKKSLDEVKLKLAELGLGLRETDD